MSFKLGKGLKYLYLFMSHTSFWQ